MRPVPLPPDIQAHYRKHDPFGGTSHGPTRTADLILDALAYGDGFLDDSLLYLTRRVREEGENEHGVVALSYMQGLYLGASNFSESEPTREQWLRKMTSTLDLLGDWETEHFRQALDGHDERWLTIRRRLVGEALAHGDGDLGRALDFVRRERRLGESLYTGKAAESPEPLIAIMEDHVGWSAYYYLMGLQAYPMFVGKGGRSAAK